MKRRGFMMPVVIATVLGLAIAQSVLLHADRVLE